MDFGIPLSIHIFIYTNAKAQPLHMIGRGISGVTCGASLGIQTRSVHPPISVRPMGRTASPNNTTAKPLEGTVKIQSFS